MWSWKVLMSFWAVPKKVSGVWCCTLMKSVSDSVTVRSLSEGERGWDLQDKGSKQWNKDLISMVQSGVCVGFSVGQSDFCLKCQKSQLWLFQLSINGGCQSIPPCWGGCCLQAACGQPCSSPWLQLLLPALATQLCTTLAGTHRKYCCFPQIHTPEGIFGSITIITNSQVDLHLTKPYFQRQEERRSSFRVQSWGAACPALSKESLHLSSSLLSWEDKHRSWLQWRLMWKLWPTEILLKYFSLLRQKGTGELVTTAHPLWHTWGRNWKCPGGQAVGGVERHKILNCPGAGVTDEAMGMCPPKT